MLLYAYLRLTARKQAGRISFWTIFGGALLLIAYMAYPAPFNDFFHYLQKTLFDALQNSFGNNSSNGAAHPHLQGAGQPHVGAGHVGQTHMEAGRAEGPRSHGK